jgi:hypothetical protein
VRQILLAWFGAVVLLFVLLKGAIDMLAGIDYAQETFPWLKRWAETKKWHRLVLLATCIFYGGTLYELLKEPPPVPITFADPGVVAIRDVVAENRLLKEQHAPFQESPNSLRRRTLKLAADLEKFWSEEPVVPYRNSPPLNPVTDEDKKRTAIWNKYWHDVHADYDSHAFQSKLLEIVDQYKSRGVPVGSLEMSAQNQMFGGPLFIGMAIVTGQVLCQTDICNLRELAFHVDAQDKVIAPDF